MPGVLEERNRYTLYLVAAIAVIAIIIFWQLMVALIFAGSIAVIALPLHKRFTGRIGAEASAALVTAIMFLIFVSVIAFAVGLLLQNQEFLNGLVSTIINWAGLGNNNPIISAFHINQSQIDGLIGNSNQMINQWADSVISQIPASRVPVAGVFPEFFCVPLQGRGTLPFFVCNAPGTIKGARKSPDSYSSRYSLRHLRCPVDHRDNYLFTRITVFLSPWI